LLFAISASGLYSCSDDDVPGTGAVDRETLIGQGRYIMARNTDIALAAEDPDKSKWFEEGTPYRLLAFAKACTDANDATPATHPRFNRVAWEGVDKGLHFINVSSEPDRLFGFSPIGDETGDPDNGLMSLDFYGFTYGKATSHRADYIELDGMAGENTPAVGSLGSLKRTERLNDDNELNDLLYGRLMNQNISTAGKDATEATQSIMPFYHCFSHLRFMVVQQSEDDEGNVPCFEDLYVDGVSLTGTYAAGAVYLNDGKVAFPEPKIERQLKMQAAPESTEPVDKVTTKQTEIGQMLVFPSNASALHDGSDGYPVGLKIAVRGSDEGIVNKLLHSSEVSSTATKGDDGMWHGTIVRNCIMSNSLDNTTDVPLYFRQNTAYTLVISFQKNTVHVITVVPQVEEWLPGEGTQKDPWQTQHLGQPQMFDNILWSDRNLGADHYDPMEEFERTIGYFYQSGRNIPYYPFDTKPYYKGNNLLDDKTKPWPTPDDKSKSVLADVEKAVESRYRFYPMVDKRILRMADGKYWGSARGDYTWTMNTDNLKPQIDIPEEKPTDTFFDFVRQGNGPHVDGLGLKDDRDNMHWETGPEKQPVSGSWKLPSSSDFMSVFPSTPFAGNITFRAGGNSGTPLSWGASGTMDINADVKTLRVTVPFYSKEKGVNSAPGNDRSDNYRKAWQTLKDNNDAGSTNNSAYTIRSPYANRYNEPDGDPEDGYASVYLISRDGNEHVKSLPEELPKDKFTIRSWGTIYAIKRIYTDKAYRMRWRVFYKMYGSKSEIKDKTPGMYVEVCRYRCSASDSITDSNYMNYDWDHPAARIYFPICGLGDWTGQYINFGTECQYATSDPIKNGLTGALHMKITGDSPYNAYIAIVKNVVNRNFGKQIRLVGRDR